MLKLVGRTVSPYTRRVAIALKLWGLPYENEPVPLADQERLRTYNPLGRIPALVLEDGESLIDSQAILDCLAERVGPDQGLLPLSGEARRRVLQANALICGAIEKAVAGYYETAQKAEGKRDEAYRARMVEQARSGLAALEARCGEPWLCGEGPSIADVTVATGFDFIAWAYGDGFQLDDYPRLRGIADAVRALPAYAETAP